MIIDDFYSGINKSEFYLGMITQVYKDHIVLQAENLSLLSHRELEENSLIPSTINYYVVVESIKGLFFGEIYQSKIASSNNIHFTSKDETWPEISIDVIGLLANGEDRFKLPGTLTAGIMDKVYIANNRIIEEYFYAVEVINDSNKNEETLSSFAVLTNNEQEVEYRPSTLFDKHLMVVGATNSGKSTSALSILDKLIKQNIKVLIIDPTGEYEAAFKDVKKLEKLKLGEDTIISVDELSLQNWEVLLETNDGTQPSVLASAIRSLRYQAKEGLEGCYVKEDKEVATVASDLSNVKDQKSFNLKDLPEQIIKESVAVQYDYSSRVRKYITDDFRLNTNQFLFEKIEYKFNNTAFLDFFGENSTQGTDTQGTDTQGADTKGTDTKKSLFKEICDFATNSNTSLYIDCSGIGMSDSIGGTIIDLVSNYIVNIEKDDINPFIFFIDEVHRYTKKGSESGGEFYNGLTTIAREGRKKGIFLFLTTQNPNDVDKVLLGQVGTLLIHRLTQYDEISAIQNYLNKQELAEIKKLNTGEAILTSANLLTDVALRIRKCEGRIQNNETPSLTGKQTIEK